MTKRKAPPKRRVPGPAGIEEACTLSKDIPESATQPVPRRNSERRKERPNASDFVSFSGHIQMERIPLYDDSLWRAPWLMGCMKHGVQIAESHCKLFIVRNDSSFVFKNNIRSIKLRQSVDSVSTVDRMMVVLRQCTMDIDAIGEVIDPFDSMTAIFTERTLKQYGNIRSGCCLVLENVAIFQSEPRRYYLNVTERNIVEVIPNDMNIGKLSDSLKRTLASFYQKLGLKTKFETEQRVKALKERERKRKETKKAMESMNINQNVYDQQIKLKQKGQKRRYSEMADDPWLDFCNSTERRKKAKINDNRNANGMNGNKGKEINIGDAEAEDDDAVIHKIRTPASKQRTENKQSKGVTTTTTVSKESVQSPVSTVTPLAQQESMNGNQSKEVMQSSNAISSPLAPSKKVNVANASTDKELPSKPKKKRFRFNRIKLKNAATTDNTEKAQSKAEGHAVNAQLPQPVENHAIGKGNNDPKESAQFISTQMKVVDKNMASQIPKDFIPDFGDLFDDF